ncbi:MAG: tRNA (pseudouridine(54)-N(1))-methyltransferase TrmY [Candidatus Aenigmarchaeota archaeon]|nr:tRNA (pseudouridine(54)-N(1))-methyltransferase TrmY [Candidatus Aenigmarchaeota archaeon]
MRHFYVKSTKGRTCGDFNLNDTAGGAGRLDIIARAVNSALWLSHSLRRDVVFHTILFGEPNPPIYIKITGEKVRKVQPDERNITIFLKKAIERFEEGRVTQTTPGIFSSRKTFEELVEENKACDFYILCEDGDDISSVDISENAFFVLGDKEDISDDEVKVLEDAGARKISLGKTPYLTSHCVGFLNMYMDRMEEKADK